MGDDQPRHVRGEHGHAALGVVEHPGAAPDQHQRQRDRGVDHADADAAEGELQELLHASPSGPSLRSPGSDAAARRRPRGWPRRPRRPPCPRLSTRPWSAIASALRAFCSTSSTVSPTSSRSCLIRSMTCATIRGARPSDGSSSSSTRGAAISARAMTRICRSPPDSVRRRPAAPLGQHREPAVGVAQGRGPAGPVAPGQRAEAQVLLHGELGDDALSLGHVRHARPGRCPRAGAGPGRCRRPAIRPSRGRTSPLIVRSSVVLPAPLAPSTAVIVPGRAVTETPSSTVTPPYPATIPSTVSARRLGPGSVMPRPPRLRGTPRSPPGSPAPAPACRPRSACRSPARRSCCRSTSSGPSGARSPPRPCPRPPA